MRVFNTGALLWGQSNRVPIMPTTPAERDALPYTERELLQKVLRALPRVIETTDPEPLWHLVSKAFDCSSDTARRICWKYGFDPERVDYKAHRQSISRLFDPTREVDDHK